jgi:hypothetical protein
MNRTAKQADDRARMGYNLSDQGAAALKGRLQQRFDQGLITQKSRQERLKTLLAQRKERQAGATAAQQKPAAPTVSATTENAGSKRLAILQGSLTKKEADLNRRFDEHFADVRSANGQPLNDKRNGPSTMARWERQSDSIRSSMTGIEKTKRAIEREKNLIDNVNSLELPPAIKTAMESGNITQWRKHPNRFFVKGVEKGRIVYFPETGTIGHHYLNDIPKEQYPLFRDTYNQLRKDLRKPAAIAEGYQRRNMVPQGSSVDYVKQKRDEQAKYLWQNRRAIQTESRVYDKPRALVQSVRSKPGYGVARASAAGNRELVGLRMKEKNKPATPPKPIRTLEEARADRYRRAKEAEKISDPKDRRQYAKFLVSLPKEVRRAFVLAKIANRHKNMSSMDFAGLVGSLNEGRNILAYHYGKHKGMYAGEDRKKSVYDAIVYSANKLRSIIKPATPPKPVKTAENTGTYGDYYFTPEGKYVQMSGSGGIGSNRVGVLDLKGNQVGRYNRDELRFANEKFRPSKESEQASERLAKITSEIDTIKRKNEGLLLNKAITEQFKKSVERGEISQAKYAELQKKGAVLSEVDYRKAIDVEGQIDKIRGTLVDTFATPKFSRGGQLAPGRGTEDRKRKAAILLQSRGLRKSKDAETFIQSYDPVSKGHGFTRKNKMFNSVLDKGYRDLPGMEIVFKPYGNKGRGFYLVGQRDKKQS